MFDILVIIRVIYLIILKFGVFEFEIKEELIFELGDDEVVICVEVMFINLFDFGLLFGFVDFVSVKKVKGFNSIKV